MPCKIAFVDKLQSFRGNPSALGDRGPAEIVRCAGMKSSIRSFSAVHDPKDQTEERAQQQACHQRKVKCHIIPLNHEVAGQPPQSDAEPDKATAVQPTGLQGRARQESAPSLGSKRAKFWLELGKTPAVAMMDVKSPPDHAHETAVSAWAPVCSIVPCRQRYVFRSQERTHAIACR